jgi:hypothetical protein
VGLGLAAPGYGAALPSAGVPIGSRPRRGVAAGGPAFDCARITNSVGAPSFAFFAKGGRRNSLRMNTVSTYSFRTAGTKVFDLILGPSMMNAVTSNRPANLPRLCIVASFLALAGCGGGGSGSPPPPPTITSVTVSPAAVQILTGASQLFTVKVTGTGAFDPSVTWFVNGNGGGTSTYGTIVGGQYVAPAVPPGGNIVTISATSNQDSTVYGNSTATIYEPVPLVSISPSAASAGEPVTIGGQNLYGPTEVVFSGTSGTSISMPVLQQISASQITATVPFGAASGPVYVNLTPVQGVNLTTNSVALTRLPNLRIHASTKDLSSGETLQLDWRLLGATTPNVLSWKADSGSVSSAGVFQAPIVTGESYSRITGCVANTNSCDVILLRILPFRITPSDPLVNIGDNIQLDAVQGGGFLAPQWSVVAGGGAISSGGLFTAPTTTLQAGPVVVSGTDGSTSEQTSIPVSGAFGGLVNRVYDYADFTIYTPKEANYFRSVAVSGNRAYVLAQKSPYQLIPRYEALDVYDISNPDQPVWIDSIEPATNSPSDLFVYGNTLFILDPSAISAYSLTTQPPSFVGTFLIPAAPFIWTFNNGVLYVLSSVYGFSATTPIDLYDLTSGTPVHKHYELPIEEGATAISGTGNIVYISNQQIDANNNVSFPISTFDVSQSPPALLGTVVSTTATALHLQVVGNLLFADSQVYDISNATPVLLTTLPLPLLKVWDVQGNHVLASGGTEVDGTPNFVVVDISSPTSPVVRANVSDLMSWDIFNPFRAAWATNERFYVTDGTGGLAVYDASPGGGPKLLTSSLLFSYIYDQVLQGHTLYEAAVYGSGEGGLACFDVSGDTPSLLGSLIYPNDSSFAVQATGTTVYVGMADSVKVIDASNPQAPTEIASVPVPVNALALSGDTLFAGTGDGRLVVFDVSTPASPKQIGSTTMPVPITIRLSGTLLLVVAEQSGFLVFDVSNPSAPIMLSQFSPSVSAPIWDVAPIGNSAVMLAADSSGIVTVDISNPSQPKQLYQAPLPYIIAFPPNNMAQAEIVTTFSLATQGGLTYVGTTNSMLFAYDASIPAQPRLMAMNVVATGSVYTSYAQGTVAAISPGTNTLYLAVQGGVAKMDNSIPENSIELYYQPAALELPVPLTDAAMRNRLDRNPKKNWMGKWSATNAQAMDRFGVARDGRRKQSTER